MTTINRSPTGPIGAHDLNQIQQQGTKKDDAVDASRATGLGRAMQADTVTATATAVRATGDVELNLPPPSPPAFAGAAAAMEGAESFGWQLDSIGTETTSTDVLMARFLKLQVLSESTDIEMQGLARATLALILKAAILASKQGMLKRANSLDGQAQQLVNQVKQLAKQYEVGGQGGDNNGFGGARGGGNAGGNVVLSYDGEDNLVVNDPKLQAALDTYAGAGELEAAGEIGDANVAVSQSLDMIGEYAKSTGGNDQGQGNGPFGGTGGGPGGGPANSGQLAELDGQTYDIGNIPPGEFQQIVVLLAKADELSTEADALRNAHTQGEAARHLRKGGYLVDSERRLVGHQAYIDAVMTVAHGSPSADQRQAALEEIEKSRREISDLILDSIGKKEEAKAAFNRAIMG